MTGLDIFLAVEETLKKLDFNKCSSITTDGAKAKTERICRSIKVVKYLHYSLHNTSGSISR